MKIVEKVLERRIQQLVNIDLMQFAFMPKRGTTDTLFVVRRMQEEYRNKKKKLYMSAHGIVGKKLITLIQK